MALPLLDRDETLSSLADSSRRWTDLIRSVRDPSATAIGFWSIRDVAVHTSHIFELFPRLIEGQPSPIKDHLRLGEEWDAKVKADPEQDLATIADRIELATKHFIDAATSDVWIEEVPWHGGLETPVYSLAGILINEAEVHGLDVASAEDRPWTVTREKAVKAIVALLPILPYFAKAEQTKGMSAVYELRLRTGPRVYISIDNGLLSIDKGPLRADCHISADPVEYLLIGYGRKSQWLPIATGKVDVDARHFTAE